MNGAWIAEILWAPDNQSLYVTMNEGTFATGAHMFEMPIVRVTLADGKAERLGSGATVEYSMSLSAATAARWPIARCRPGRWAMWW